MVACMSGSVLARGFGVLSSSWRDSLILFSFLTLFVNTWTLLMVLQIPGVSSSLAATGVVSSLILSVLIYALPLLFILFSTEYIAPFWYHFFCLLAFLLLFTFMFTYNSCLSPRLLTYRRPLPTANAYGTHLPRRVQPLQASDVCGEGPITGSFRMYKCACVIRIVLFVRLGCVLLQHVLLPWWGVGDSVTDVLVMMMSDGAMLGGICFVYPLRGMESALTKRCGRR